MSQLETTRLENEFLRLTTLNLGARIHRLELVPLNRPLVLSYPRLTDYEGEPNFLNATIGPNANRLAGGHFDLPDGPQEWGCNEGEKNLHSGALALHQRRWTLDRVQQQAADQAPSLTYTIEMDQPVAYQAQVTYQLEGPALRIQIQAQSPHWALFNFTNHTYFNLAGGGAADEVPSIAHHRVRLFADFWTPFRADQLPDGRVLATSGTPLDLDGSRLLGEDLARLATFDGSQGFDHNYVVKGRGLRPLAELRVPDLSLTLSSDAPAFQFYTGQGLRWAGQACPFKGLCVEPQFVPDAIHFPYLAQPVFAPGQPFERTVVYRFDW